MAEDLPNNRSALLTGAPRVGQWGILFVLSLAFALLLELTGLPAALLLGPMIGAILVETNGGVIRVPALTRLAAQAVIGCMLAGAVTPEIVGTFLKEWPLLIGVVLLIVLASSVIGWIIGKSQIMPGTTTVWGLSPGAATASMLMAGAYGADVRLVAFMQYLRVVIVVATASVITRLWVHVPTVAHQTIWFPPIDPAPFGETIALAIFGGVVGRMLRFPVAAMLVPMFVGATLHGAGLIQIELPHWLLALSYALLGWMIGLNFSRQILVHAIRTLPQVLLSIVALIAFCGGLAFTLVKALGIDPLTAYLATSPGGADSVAIIAVSAKVDLSFVMALQTVRFLIVLAIGPTISRFVARRLEQELEIGTLK